MPKHSDGAGGGLGASSSQCGFADRPPDDAVGQVAINSKISGDMSAMGPTRFDTFAVPKYRENGLIQERSCRAKATRRQVNLA